MKSKQVLFFTLVAVDGNHIYITLLGDNNDRKYHISDQKTITCCKTAKNFASP